MKYAMMILMVALVGCQKKSSAASSKEQRSCDSETVYKLDDTLIASNCTGDYYTNCGVILKQCDEGLEYYCLTNIKVKIQKKNNCN